MGEGGRGNAQAGGMPLRSNRSYCGRQEKAMGTTHTRLVYLAGPITACSYDRATDWRNYIRERLDGGIVGVSPMRNFDHLRGEQNISDHYVQSVLTTPAAIMARDSFDVRRADMLLVNLLGTERVSIGTMLEVGMAYALNKPIVLLIEERNIHEHSMLREAAGWLVSTLNEGIHVVNCVLGTGE